MSRPEEIECKKLFAYRCLHAISLSVAVQFLLLTVFLLFVNFSILHPILWLTKTIGLIFTFSTWFYIIPLIVSITLYGVFLGNSYLSIPKYYSSRFVWLYLTGLKKIITFTIYSIIGYLTAWLYSRFLSEEYHNLLFECFNNYCLNSRYIFLSLIGIYSGLLYLFKERLTRDPEIKFPIIQQLQYVQIRNSIYSILYNSLLKTFIPTICYTLCYWLFGWIITKWLADQLNIQYDQSLDSIYAILNNYRLLFYVWILSSQILSNMYIMEMFFTVLLTQEIQFPIEKNPVLKQSDVTIVDALSLTKIPIIQQLASFNLFNLANSKYSKKRQQIFSLSIPGGHPYNWNQLSGQCLSMINAYTSELAISVKKISTVKSIDYCNITRPTATETAEKILLRQYNETRGIRNMMTKSNNLQSIKSITECNDKNSKTVNDNFVEFSKAIDKFCKTLFRSIPGLFYIFGESEGAKTEYLLSKSQDIIWLTQGLSGLCASSLEEDKYGVVQCELPAIIKALLGLKLELDKLNNVNLNGKKVNRNCIALKNAVKRSLYRICTVFSNYIKDLINDPDELRHLQCFINYQEW